MAKDRPEAEQVAIRDALSNERTSAKYGWDPPDPEAQAALATWRSEHSCASAKSSHDANLDAVKSAWNSATGG